MTEGNEELDAAKVTQCDVELCWSSKNYGVSLRTQDLQVWIYQPLPGRMSEDFPCRALS